MMVAGTIRPDDFIDVTSRKCNHCKKHMPVIRRFAACLLRINSRDHAPPHFHVILNDGREAWVRINDTQIIHKDVSARQIADALAWAGANRVALAAKFEELQR